MAEQPTSTALCSITSTFEVNEVGDGKVHEVSLHTGQALTVPDPVTHKEEKTHVRNDDGELRVERVVHFADGALVAPEGVVVLTVLGIRVSHRGEHLVPGCRVGVGLRNAVRRLPTNQKQASTESFISDREAERLSEEEFVPEQDPFQPRHNRVTVNNKQINNPDGSR